MHCGIRCDAAASDGREEVRGQVVITVPARIERTFAQAQQRHSCCLRLEAGRGYIDFTQVRQPAREVLSDVEPSSSDDNLPPQVAVD
jgi:hypothetical protein